jgi:hypothetical protein
LLERALRDCEDLSRVVLPLAEYGDSLLQRHDHELFSFG